MNKQEILKDLNYSEKLFLKECVSNFKCDNCLCNFEYDEGKIYDNETFVCFECIQDIADETIKQSI